MCVKEIERVSKRRSVLVRLRQGRHCIVRELAKVWMCVRKREREVGEIAIKRECVRDRG